MVVVFVDATNALVIKSSDRLCDEIMGHKDISTQWIESFRGGRRVQSKCSAAGLARARDLLVLGKPSIMMMRIDEGAPDFMNPFNC